MLNSEEKPSGASQHARRGWKAVAAMAVVFSAALAFGWPSRNGQFLAGDDQRLVLHHVFVNHPSWGNALRLLGIVHDDLYQPLPLLSLQANYALAAADPHGRFPVSAYGFHVANILLHACNAVLAALLARRIARCWRVGILCGLFFACHPFSHEAVDWVNGRMMLMATLFSLAMLLICVRLRPDEERTWPVVAGITWLAAMLSKLLPTLAAAAAWCDWRVRGRLTRRAASYYLALMLLSAVASILTLRLTRTGEWIEAISAESANSGPVRWALSFRYYIENYFWPRMLAGWHPPPPTTPFVSVAVGIAVLETIALAWVAIWLGRRTPAVLTGIVLFGLLLLPFLAATAGRRILAADRYMYLPIVGLHLAFAAFAVDCADRLARMLATRSARLAVATPVAIALVVWINIGWRLARTWATTIDRHSYVMDVYPDEPLARVEMARALNFENRPNETLAIVAAARQRWGDLPKLLEQSGEAYLLKHDWSRAKEELGRAVRASPRHPQTRYRYGQALEKLGRLAEARQVYSGILQDEPGHLPSIVALAKNFASTGDKQSAMLYFRRALQVNAYDRQSLFDLAMLHVDRHEWDAARSLLARILELDPKDGPARMNLAVCLARSGHGPEALAIYDSLLADEPTSNVVQLNRAGLLAEMGRNAEAEAAYRKIMGENGNARDAIIGLHELLQKQGRGDDLVALWQNVAGSTGKTAEWKAWLGWAYMLADRRDEAVKMFPDIPRTSPERAFAVWAQVFDDLRRNDEADAQHDLASMPLLGGMDAVRQEQARIVRMALSSLPREVRDSPAGLYTLARALAFDGQNESAAKVARQLLDIKKTGYWGLEARRLLDALETTTPQGTGAEKSS